MATKQIALRVGEQTQHQLNYLMWVSRAKSHAEVVRTLVGLVADAVAAGVNPDDSELFYHGGTVLTEGEQRAYQQVVEVLQSLSRPTGLR